MRGQFDQLGSYVHVIKKKLLNKATADTLLGMLRTQELPFKMGGLSCFTNKITDVCIFLKKKSINSQNIPTKISFSGKEKTLQFT